MSRKWDKLVAWSELLGGIAGLLILLPIAAIQRGGALTPIYYIGAGFGFLLAMIAGWRLLRGKQFGRELSVVLQILQVVQIIANGWMFKYVTGLQLLLKIGPSGVEFSPGVNAAVWLGPTLAPAPSSIGINLFALWATIYLARQLAVNRLRLPIADPDLTAESTSSTSIRPA
jgi:hypothetical protein